MLQLARTGLQLTQFSDCNSIFIKGKQRVILGLADLLRSEVTIPPRWTQSGPAHSCPPVLLCGGEKGQGAGRCGWGQKDPGHRSWGLQAASQKWICRLWGMWGEIGRDGERRGKESLGVGGRAALGCLSHKHRAPDVSLDIRLVRGKLALGPGSDSGACVVLYSDGPFPAQSTPQRGCAPYGRCCCISTWKAGVGSWGPGQQSPATPRRGTPAPGPGSSRRCKPALWLPVAACPPSVGTAVNPR